MAMKKQRVLVWTGGQNCLPQRQQPMADALPVFPDPVPLRQIALIEYQWGEAKFQIVATACSLRTSTWGDEQVTWLHCRAMQTSAINPDGPTSLMNILIPVRYITRLGPGSKFRLLRSREPDDIGVFPPNQPTPANALALEQIERGIAELMIPERN
jgi:hypothetical protein